MSSEIRDIQLAASGEQKIEWVKRNCDLLRMLEEEFGRTKPFARYWRPEELRCM